MHGDTPDERSDRANPTEHERVAALLQLLKVAVGAYRAKHGRDAVRAMPWGRWLDALDSGRTSLHPPDDAAAAAAAMRGAEV